MNHSPRNQINVFISSAQNKEKGFDWTQLRLKIKNKLLKCQYLNPFIIEDGASEIPSTQLFAYQVKRSDIVVFLLKGELRKGTSAEFALAKKIQKPFLVYFIKENNPEIDIIRLQKEIIENDYCTFCGPIEPHNIEQQIYDDIINNVILYYQCNHYNKFQQPDETIILPNNSELIDTKPYVMNKVTLTYFKSCYNEIYNLIGYQYLKSEDIKETSLFHIIGTKLIKWLIRGETFFSANELAELVEQTKEFYTNVDWLSKRLEAIGKFFDGNIEEAFSLECEALTLAQKNKTPEWILNDILIDCRNFENAFNSKNNSLKYGKYQIKLDHSSSFIYLPVCDRFLEEVYSETIKEDIKLKTQSHNTISFGTSLGKIINNIENYLFSSILYGSCIHLILCRQALAQIFYKYGKLLEDENMICLSLSLYLLNGCSKEFKQILNKEWDIIYSSIISNADYLWNLTNNLNTMSKNTSKLMCLEYFGLYISDENFSSAELYLFDFAKSVTLNESEAYFECLSKIAPRLNHEKLISALIPIINENRFNLGSGITKILFEIDIKYLPKDLLLKLRDALNDKMNQIISRNGDPQSIALLVKQRPEIFTPLIENPNNGISGIQKVFFDLNLGNGNWENVLKEVISEVAIQYEKHKNKTSYTYFTVRPFDLIARIMNEYYSVGMENYISGQFIPICIKILTNPVALQLKDDCLNALCSVVALYIKMGITIPKDIIEAIATCDVSNSEEIPFITHSTKETLKLRLTILKVLLEIENKESLFSWCFEYSKKEINNRIVLANCVLALLRKSTDVSKELDLMILTMIFQFSEDEYYVIRSIAVECLAIISNSKYAKMVEDKLFELVFDSSPYVRTSLIKICGDEKYQNKEFSRKVIETLTQDANFAIRKIAIERLSKKGR